MVDISVWERSAGVDIGLFYVSPEEGFSLNGGASVPSVKGDAPFNGLDGKPLSDSEIWVQIWHYAQLLFYLRFGDVDKAELGTPTYSGDGEFPVPQRKHLETEVLA